MIAQDMLQHKNFINPAHDVRLVVKLTIDQANQVMRLVLARWPELAEMRKTGQLQSINAGGQFRLAGVRGGQLPATVTRVEVAHLVQAVLDSQPADLVDPAFDEESRRYAGRARR